jgi:sulfatase maturation enzyme AslB (radical SAM superfamily)
MLYEVNNLDIVITRNCQLDCSGCLTFSNHNKAKEHLNLEDNLKYLDFWSDKLDVNTIHIFGGEPFMHPNLFDWVYAVRDSFRKKQTSKSKAINIQTNGIKISSYDIDKLQILVNDCRLSINITIHSKEQWYLEKINKAIAVIEKIYGTGHWEKINQTDKRYVNEKHIWVSVSDQTEKTWINHYLGHGKTLRPSFEFDLSHYVANHSHCEAKEYVQLYKGNLYKCPPMAVLDETLKLYDYPNQSQWQPWLEYQPLFANSTDEEIKSWLDKQKVPEKYCNMCFGSEEKNILHRIKVKKHE